MDLIKQLTTDHRRFLMTLSSINSLLFGEDNAYFSKGRNPEVTGTILELLHELTQTMIRHEEVEQRVLFPILEERLPGVVGPLHEIDRDHGTTLRLLTDLENDLIGGKGAANRRIIERYLELQRHLDQHILREETELYEPARANIPAKELQLLGNQVEMAYL